MDWGLAERLGVSRGVLILVILIAIVQLTLQVLAWISLYRAREVTFGNKWIWAVAVLLGLVGVLLYFALGRRVGGAPAAPEAEPGTPDGGERAQRAVDALYGPKDKD